jgi:hypothetical protein
LTASEPIENDIKMLKRLKRIGNLLGGSASSEATALTAPHERPEFLGVGLDELRQHFDAEFYHGVYSDVAAAGADPFEHYLNYGWREGREPFLQFHSSLYELSVVR